MSLRDDLSTALRELSQNSYLLAVATVHLQTCKPSDIAASLQPAVQQLCGDKKPLPPGSVVMKPAEVRKRLPHVSQFVTDVLLVEMQAVFHSHLMLAANHTLDEPAKQIEALLGGWPGRLSPKFSWAYRDIILLTEIRNAVMHARGAIHVPNERLKNAGWSPDALAAEPSLTNRSFSDFLRFKRAVRTVANEVLPDSP